MKSPRRSCRPTVDAVTIPLLILLALVLAVSVPVAAQPEYPAYRCRNLATPYLEFCDGSVCAKRLKECEFDFDGLITTGYEQRAEFWEDVGTDTNPPFGVGDRSCYQGDMFDDTRSAPDAVLDEYGTARFAVLLPVGYTSGPLKLYMALRGGPPGWVLPASPGLIDSWTLEFDDPFNPTWEKGEYIGNIDWTKGGHSEGVVIDHLRDKDGLVARMRQKGWAILVPNGCSNDSWNGRASEFVDFPEASRTRFGFETALGALQIVEQAYGIEYFFVGGNSAGGIGSFLLANDLIPTLGATDPVSEAFRGAIMDSAAFEADNWENLFLEADLTNGNRDIDINDSCPGTEATVPCDMYIEPVGTAFDNIGISGKAASTAIDSGTPIPILHSWNKRDTQFCSDVCYSNDFLHGLIIDAIERRQSNGTDEDFDDSENVEVCAGECVAITGETVQCVKHDLIDQRFKKDNPVLGVLDCIEDWIDAINVDRDGGAAYTTPPSCAVSIEQDLNLPNPPACTDPGLLDY